MKNALKMNEEPRMNDGRWMVQMDGMDLIEGSNGRRKGRLKSGIDLNRWMIK